MHIADSHNHLHFSEFHRDLTAVVNRARHAGVQTMLLVGIDPEDTLRALHLAETGKGLFVSIGIHPQKAKAFSREDVLSLAPLASRQAVVAVGETGFDLYRSPKTEKQQRELFIAHIDLAKTLSLPLVIHDREAHRQTIAILDSEGAWPVGGVFHCFSGDTELAALILDKGFSLSVPGVVTYKNASLLRDVVRMCPVDSLLIETDAPYLSPGPFRGKRNEPSYLPYTIREIAAIKGCTVEKIAEITTENFYRLFSKAGKIV